jgi:hypothetical protein
LIEACGAVINASRVKSSAASGINRATASMMSVATIIRCSANSLGGGPKIGVARAAFFSCADSRHTIPAKALSLTVPEMMLATADEVIQ